MLKEAGLYRPADPAAASIMVVPLFETIGDQQNAPQVMQRPGSRCRKSARIARRRGFSRR